jgi:putative sterol carrier protein
VTMTVREFFEQAPGRVSAEQARKLEASYRFDIEGAGSWRLEADGERVVVIESDAPADCVVKTDEATFLGLVGGTQSAMGAFMAGRIRVEGDLGLALRLRDLFA